MFIKNTGNLKLKLIGLALFLLIVGGAAAYFTRDDSTIAEYRVVARHVLATHAKHPLSENMTAACGSPDCKAVIAVAKTENKDKEEINNKEEIYTMFQADPQGNLVLGETTRLNIEKLYALNTPEELADKMQKLSKVLPETAHRQVGNLVDYFEKYTRNVKEIYPPDTEPTTMEDVLDRFKGMHDLRLMHFGADVTSAFYAEEEKQALQLLYLMAIEKDQSLSLDAKAQRAQQLLQTNPELAAAYDPDRK